MKKVLKVVFAILLVGFVSVFVRGYQYQSSKAKQRINNENLSEKIKTENSIINDDVIVDLLDEEIKEDDPINNTNSIKQIEEKTETKTNNIPEQKNTTNNSNVETKNNNSNSTNQSQSTIKEEVKETKGVKQENTIKIGRASCRERV